MPAIITDIIASQAFEVVRDRIGLILKEELDNQYALSNEDALKAQVFKERFSSFDKEELPAINVTFDRVEYGQQDQRQTNGTCIYYIDAYANAKTNSAASGDERAKSRLHRLLGVCRAILEDPQYKKLGFTNPLVMYRNVSSIGIAPSDHNDGLSSVMGRIVFEVKVPETTAFIDPIQIADFETTIKLVLTEKGYRYVGPVEIATGNFDYDFDFDLA